MAKSSLNSKFIVVYGATVRLYNVDSATLTKWKSALSSPESSFLYRFFVITCAVYWFKSYVCFICRVIAVSKRAEGALLVGMEQVSGVIDRMLSNCALCDNRIIVWFLKTAAKRVLFSFNLLGLKRWYSLKPL